MIVTAWNPETSGLEKTYLSQVVQKNSNTLKVKNADRVVTGRRILIGEMGMEQSEVLTVGTPVTSDTIPTTGNTVFAHSADEAVYVLLYDQIAFYRSSAADGIYSLIATVNIDVDNKDQQTLYNDTAGTGTSFYKTKFYNSVTAEESGFSDYISAAGYQENTIGKVIESMVSIVNDREYQVLTSEDYINLATEVNYDISSQSERPYKFTRVFTDLDREAGKDYLELPDDYYKFDELEYVNVVGSYPRTKRLTPISREQFDTGYGMQAASDMISRVVLDDESRRIYLKPTPRTNYAGAFRLWYYFRLGEFKNLTDLVRTPNTLIYYYKFRAEYYAKKAETDNSFARLETKYDQKYGNELMKLQRSNQRDVGTARSFNDSANNRSTKYVEGRRYRL